MKKLRRLLPLLARFLGLLGIVACVAAIIIVWFAGAQISLTNEHAFDGIDKTLTAIRGRVLDAQRRVQESKISTEDIETSVKDWTGKEATERLASRLEVAEKSEQLVHGLQQADAWLATSEESIRDVQQAFEIGSSLGAPLDADFVNALLEQLGNVAAPAKANNRHGRRDP